HRHLHLDFSLLSPSPFLLPSREGDVKTAPVAGEMRNPCQHLCPLAGEWREPDQNPSPLAGEGRERGCSLPTQQQIKNCELQIAVKIFLVPRLRLGTHIFRALPGIYLEFWPIMEAEPPGHAFPGGAWEREVIAVRIEH